MPLNGDGLVMHSSSYSGRTGFENIMLNKAIGTSTLKKSLSFSINPFQNPCGLDSRFNPQAPLTLPLRAL
jgi:hypothetical protein